MKWSINKDETIILKNKNLLGGIWRQTRKETEGLIAVVYGEYPSVWLHEKFFIGYGQVKEAKKWIEGLT
jgi:hypothetical protein